MKALTKEMIPKYYFVFSMITDLKNYIQVWNSEKFWTIHRERDIEVFFR